MKCHEVDELLQAHDPVRVPLIQDPALARHLAGCPQCRQAWEEERLLSLSLARLPRAKAPQDFEARLAQRLQQMERMTERVPKPRRFLWLQPRWLWLLPAGVAMGLIVMFMLTPHRPEAERVLVKGPGLYLEEATSLDPQEVQSAFEEWLAGAEEAQVTRYVLEGLEPERPIVLVNY